MNFMTKRIFKIDTKKLKKLINKCSKKSGKPKIVIFFDMAYCVFKYQAGYVDYDAFNMYEMNRKERKTIMTRGKNNDLVKELNPKEHWHVLNNKDEFNNIFKDFLNRDFFIINDENNNFNEFEKFVEKHNEFIVKPKDQSCGVGIRKVKTIKNKKKLYNELKENNTPILEELAVQHKDISKLHSASINTIRVVTIKNKYDVTSIVAAFIRIGTGGRVVDNFNNGGICCPIDIKTGVISAPAVDKDGNVYDTHPTTNIKLIGYQLPNWEKLEKFVDEVSHIYPELGYIGWDICIGADKLSLIEANQFPGHDIYQLPVHRKNNIGVIPLFEEALNKKK